MLSFYLRSIAYRFILYILQFLSDEPNDKHTLYKNPHHTLFPIHKINEGNYPQRKTDR